MSREVSPCDECGTETRGDLCLGCRDGVGDAADALAESIAEATDDG